MSLTEGQTIKKYTKRCGHCIGNTLLLHTNMNLLAFLVVEALTNESMKSVKYNERNIIL